MMERKFGVGRPDPESVRKIGGHDLLNKTGNP